MSVCSLIADEQGVIGCDTELVTQGAGTTLAIGAWVARATASTRSAKVKRCVVGVTTVACEDKQMLDLQGSALTEVASSGQRVRNSEVLVGDWEQFTLGVSIELVILAWLEQADQSAMVAIWDTSASGNTTPVVAWQGRVQHGASADSEYDGAEVQGFSV